MLDGEYDCTIVHRTNIIQKFNSTYVFSLWADHYYSLKLRMKLHYSSISWFELFTVLHWISVCFQFWPCQVCVITSSAIVFENIYTLYLFFFLPYLSSLSLILDCDFDSPLFSFPSLFPPVLSSVTTRSQWQATMILTILATSGLEVDLNRFLVTSGSF